MGPWKCFSSILLLSCAVPFLGPCLGSFFEVFCIKVAEAQRFGFNEPFWLMATGRATVPTLYACCLTKRSCHFLFVARVGLCCWFCDFAVSFLVPPDGPKNGTVKVLFFYSFTKLCMRSMATGRATREALLSEAGFEKLFRTQNWVRRSKLFCRWFCFLLGQAGCISVAAWTQLKDVEGSFLWFRFVWWLDCLLLKEGRRISLLQP